MIQELLELLGDLTDGRHDGSSFNNAFGDGVAKIGLVRRSSSPTDKRWIINVTHIIGLCAAQDLCEQETRHHLHNVTVTN